MVTLAHKSSHSAKQTHKVISLTKPHQAHKQAHTLPYTATSTGTIKRKGTIDLILYGVNDEPTNPSAQATSVVPHKDSLEDMPLPLLATSAAP